MTKDGIIMKKVLGAGIMKCHDIGTAPKNDLLLVSQEPKVRLPLSKDLI